MEFIYTQFTYEYKEACLLDTFSGTFFIEFYILTQFTLKLCMYTSVNTWTVIHTHKNTYRNKLNKINKTTAILTHSHTYRNLLHQISKDTVIQTHRHTCT